MIYDPGNTYPINILYAWVTVDKDGNEGIIATTVGPMVFGHLKSAELTKPLVEAGLKQTGGKYKAHLVSFSNKRILKTLEGE